MNMLPPSSHLRGVALAVFASSRGGGGVAGAVPALAPVGGLALMTRLPGAPRAPTTVDYNKVKRGV